MKSCSKCNTLKPLDMYGKQSCHKDGFTSQCKDCRNSRLRDSYNNSQKVKDQTKNRHLKNHFGITLEEYNLMFEQQNGCCKTCNRHQAELGRTLAVDHNHKTGKVRGLLCDYCNRLLGSYEKKPELFAQFDVYLKEDKNGNN